MSEYKKAKAYVATVKKNAMLRARAADPLYAKGKAVVLPKGHSKGRALAASARTAAARSRALRTAPTRQATGAELTKHAIRIHQTGGRRAGKKTVPPELHKALVKATAKTAGQKLAQEAANRGRGGTHTSEKARGAVSKDIQKAKLQLNAQIAGKKLRAPVIDGTGFLKATPAKVLRRPNINDLVEIDKAGLSFPSLHDEFQKTMSLLHGGEVGDHL
tara:strand:+ start:2537 stop:3187 length:651 start_codon:yes stop_codon:yes gene_type:complete